MANELQGKRIAFVMANEGVEQVEFTEPRKAVEQAGAEVDVIAPQSGQIQAFNHLDKADTFDVDKTTSDAKSDDYDASFFPAAWRTRTSCAPTRTGFASCGSSSRPASRSARSATRPGRWSRRTSSTAAS